MTSGMLRIPRIAFSIILSFALLIFEIRIGATETQKETSSVEITFSGTGPGETKSFTVQDGWKIQWETESPTFRLSAHGTARRPYVGATNERDEILRRFEAIQPIILANTTDSRGTAFHPLGGTFHLVIEANGSWRIHLKTFKDTKDYLDVPYTGAP